MSRLRFEREAKAIAALNLERGRATRGGSAVVNRACELLGKELGMFKEPDERRSR
jgi:hypothetical protein